MIRFPIDCPMECPHLQAWDMSVDDWTYVCNKLSIQIDGCDTLVKWLLPICPIEKGERMTNGEAVNWIINISADIGKTEHRDLWHYEQALSEIREMLESEQPEPHWIPTSKERPPQHQEIWITDDFGDVELVYGKDGVWLFEESYCTESGIIAWMPASVPEPYQPKEESE